jgi:uncharacterized DUF497 family protein
LPSGIGSVNGVTFLIAQGEFLNTKRIIVQDLSHSKKERKYYCSGEVENGIVKVRFTLCMAMFEPEPPAG